MDHLQIPIPDGLPEDQKRDLTGWLTQQVEQITGEGPSIDDDPEVRAEIVRRIKEGMKAVDEGRVYTSEEARAYIEEKLGINRKRA